MFYLFHLNLQRINHKKVFNGALINNIFVLYSVANHPNKLCIMYKNVSKSQNAKNREK